MSTMSTRPDAGAAGPREEAPRLPERAEAGLVAVAVAQALLVAVWLVGFTSTALRAGSFPPAPPFFVRWAGVLQAVLAAGYALEWSRFRRVSLLVVAKTATALFLGVTWTVSGLPPLMMAVTVLEGLTAAAAALLHGPADRAHRSRIKLKLVTLEPGQVQPAGRR